VNKRFRVCDLNQPFLFAPSLQDWLPENHLARFVAEVCNELDLAAIYAEYERSDGRGLSAYHPLLLTRLLLYGYSIGMTSSRAIEKATYDSVAFRYLAADQHPDHDTIANFRQQHLEALAGLLVQALRLCSKAGLVQLGSIAVDGTKMLANASTRHSVSHQKLGEQERYWQSTVERLLADAQRKDEQEDQRFGKGESAESLPEELARAQSRLERIRQAKAELEREAQQELEALGPGGKRGRPRKQDIAGLSEEQRRHLKKKKKKLSRARKNAQQPSRQYNFVDPDSRVMKDNGRKCFVQGYNAQIAVDALQKVIVAAEVTQQTTDREQLVPMVNSVRANNPIQGTTIIADAGYWDTASLHHPTLKGMRVAVSPDSQPQLPGAPLPPNAPNNEEALRMREWLTTPAGRALYILRKMTVEPVFGQIKEARGLRRFRLRGLRSVQCEWKLICATHNLLKLFRHALNRTLVPPGLVEYFPLYSIRAC
jgi:transposase